METNELLERNTALLRESEAAINAASDAVTMAVERLKHATNELEWLRVQLDRVDSGKGEPA